MAHDIHDRLLSDQRRRGVSWEYRTYFVVVFLMIALPMAVWQWTAGVFHPGDPNPGVAQRAMSEARIIATTIFSA